MVHISRRAALAGVAASSALALTGGFGAHPVQASAPMKGPLRPSVYRFKLGAFEVATVFDGSIQLDGPHPIFGENQEAADVQALLESNLLPKERFEIGFTPTIVNTGTELVLFDAGNGAGRRPDAGSLRERLTEAGYPPESIDVVVLTHFHPDHIGGLMEDGTPAFPNARYVASSTEYDFWSPQEKASGPTERVGKLVQANVVPFAEKMSFIGNGDQVVSGITGLAANGHTPGHMVFHLESEGKRLAITADTANHFVVSLQRPDWHVRFDMDKAAAAKARQDVFGMLAADKIPFAGYHMPFPSVGYVEPLSGGGFRYVPASYQLNLG